MFGRHVARLRRRRRRRRRRRACAPTSNTASHDNHEKIHSFPFLYTKYRRHTDPNGKYDQNEMKRYRGLNYFKQNCAIFRFAMQTFVRV